VVSPDGKSLYLMCGNGTRLPPEVSVRRPVATSGIDHLMPPGFESSRHTPAGWVCRLDPDGGPMERICSGLRNRFDLAFNRDGDLFTFDSDMEWDLGAPWYRPTRICQIVSGGEFGWRDNAATWPEYYEDSLPPVVNIGPASPTGIAFGYGSTFPERYRQALFACDWTFATIHAIHLQRQKSFWAARVFPSRIWSSVGTAPCISRWVAGVWARPSTEFGTVVAVSRQNGQHGPRRIRPTSKPRNSMHFGGAWKNSTGKEMPTPSMRPGRTSVMRIGWCALRRGWPSRPRNLDCGSIEHWESGRSRDS
jgi:hypothetical protein